MKTRREKWTQILFLVTLVWLTVTTRILPAATAENTTIWPVNVGVGVVLDNDSWVGKMGLSCIEMAISDFYASHGSYNTRLVPHIRDSYKDAVGAAAAALDLMKNVQVQAIIGPQQSMQANFAIYLGQKAQVPIISFSATSPSLTSLRSPYFIRIAQNDSYQVQAISAIIQAFGWREAVPIYVDNEFGEGIIPYLTEALQDVDTRIPYHSLIPSSASDDEIGLELYKLMTMEARVFVVHMDTNLGSKLFLKAKEIGMMEDGYVWIVTDSIMNCLSVIDHSIIEVMQGVLGVKTYVPGTVKLDNFTVRWKRKLIQDNVTIGNHELEVFGLWAYDATWALAMAIEKAGTENLVYQNSNGSNRLTDLEAFGVNQNGEKLRHALIDTQFSGMAGEFKLINEQLESTTFEIVNVNGNGGRTVGFWTSENGLTNVTGISSSSTSKGSLGTIVWPGDTTLVPKGWEIPTNGKKLKIGVPVKNGFAKFVTVTKYPETNTSLVTGYCIDVFKAVLEELPYDVSYEFSPFEDEEGNLAGTYDDLVYNVHLKNYDAVIGDITIIANRSLYVDFTLPYTESGVSMVVLGKDDSRKNAWVFLKPLTWDLWVTTVCFFIYIGFVVWLLEHRINDDFRGPLEHQIGTSLWFSFSTMVFAHREVVFNNLARFVVIVWCFVVLILTQSYTASLTSLLTVEQLQPSVSDINELLIRRLNVGYLEGSFVYGILKSLKFEDSNLIPYASPQQMDDLFSKGSEHGGISAALDEIPYIRLLLSQYTSKYIMGDPRYKTGGFGFVFPTGSPLVGDISRAILKVTEGDKMTDIERIWFGDQSRYLPSNSELRAFGLESFWGLFLITGVTSVFAVIIAGAMFLRKEWQSLKNNDSEASIWKRICAVARHYDKKDLTSHAFRKSTTYLEDKSGQGIAMGRVHGGAVVPIETSPSDECPSSPLDHSIETVPSFEIVR